MSAKPSPIDDMTIARLAELSLLDYGRERKSTAKEMGVNVSALDSAVKQSRKESSDVSTRGRAITLYEPELWPEPVDGEGASQAVTTVARCGVAGQ